MRLSSRNMIKGKVTDVELGTVAAKVKVDIGGGNAITSTLTVEAVEELEIKVGDEIVCFFRASSVMLGKD